MILAYILYGIGAFCVGGIWAFLICLGGQLRGRDILMALFITAIWPIYVPAVIIRLLMNH